MKQILAKTDGIVWVSDNARDRSEQWLEIVHPDSHKTLQTEYIINTATWFVEDGETVSKGTLLVEYEPVIPSSEITFNNKGKSEC